MKKAFFILSFLSAKLISYSQYEINPSLSTCSVLIEAKGFGSGSGVYLQDSNYMYLVTAAHVLIDLQKNIADCDSIFLITYRENSETDKSDTLLLSLCNAIKNGYAIVDPANDILVIKLAQQKKLDSLYSSINYFPHALRLGKGTKINSFGIREIRKFDKVKIGNDALMFGYPKSLNLQFSFDYNRPLLRKGTIAGRDFKKKRIILDCPAFQGNSGGPVYMVDLTEKNNIINLIGIVSEFIPFVEFWSNDKYKGVNNVQISNSGYSVIIPIDFALDLILKLK